MLRRIRASRECLDTPAKVPTSAAEASIDSCSAMEISGPMGVQRYASVQLTESGELRASESTPKEERQRVSECPRSQQNACGHAIRAAQVAPLRC